MPSLRVRVREARGQRPTSEPMMAAKDFPQED